MSTQINKEISCPHCGAAVKTEMWAGISAQENPELRNKVLSETMFDWKCPECGYAARFLYPCLYHDKNLKFMVYVAPGGCDIKLQPPDVCEKFPQLSGVKKRLVTSPVQLKEKILIFEAGLDDYAVELVKLAMGGVLSKKYGKNTVGSYFCYTDEKERKMGFSFFLEGESEPVRRGTRMEVYSKSLEIINQAAISAQGGGFTPVDSVTAQKILEEYRG